MTSVVVLPGRLAGVQPNKRFSCGPTVAPFGPHWLSGTTPVFVVESNAPITAVGLVGSITSIPPSHWGGPCRKRYAARRNVDLRDRYNAEDPPFGTLFNANGDASTSNVSIIIK